jgi:spore coat protein H
MRPDRRNRASRVVAPLVGQLVLAAFALGCSDDAQVVSPGSEPGDTALSGTGGEGAAGPGGAGSVANGGGSASMTSIGSSGAGPLGSGGSGSSGSSAGGAAGTGSGRVEVLDPSSGWVFDDAELRTYELTLDPGVWAALQANARDEQYAEAELDVAGMHVSRVAVRYKGSLGTLTSCFADDGTRTCSKLSMKLKFDEYLPDQQFQGLKRLVFNSMQWDPSLLHERLAYRVFREMGVAAPRSAHARLVINGEALGVFSLVEDVDGRFTDAHFAGGDGNLYKEQWPNSDDVASLTASLETNQDVPDHSVLLQFRQALSGASDEQLPGVVARYMDLDSLFAYLAVDRTLTNWDGMTAFYCYEDYCENHNYYLYQDEVEPRFTLIPWDLDNTFEVTSPLATVPGVFEIPADCSERLMAMGRIVMPPACDPLLRGLALADRGAYAAALDRLLAGPFVVSTLEGWLDAWQAQLEPVVAGDANGPGLGEFRAAVEILRGSLATLRDRAIADRSSHL